MNVYNALEKNSYRKFNSLRLMDYRQWPLDNWVLMFNELYKVDEDETDEKIWLYVVKEFGKLAENLRKQNILNYDKKRKMTGVLADIPDVFAWASIFASRHGSLEEMVWHKYPNLCHNCFFGEDCSCITKKSKLKEKEREQRLELYRQEKENYPLTLHGWQKMFDRIYGKTNRKQGIEMLYYHLQEEIGEVAEAILHEDESKIKEECADVFAWLVGLTIKSEELAKKICRLDDITWQRYKH